MNEFSIFFEIAFAFRMPIKEQLFRSAIIVIYLLRRHPIQICHEIGSYPANTAKFLCRVGDRINGVPLYISSQLKCHSSENLNNNKS